MISMLRAFVFFFCLCGVTVAQPPVCTRPIKVGLYDLGAFYNPVTKSGIDKDVVEEIERRTGCSFELLYMARVRIWVALREGSLDMTVSAIETPERREFAYFIPYMWMQNELVMQEDKLAPASPADFLADDRLRIGVVKSYRHGAGWDEWITAIRQRKAQRVIEATDSMALFTMLNAGRIDAAPALPVITLAQKTRYPQNQPLQRLHWFSDQKKIDASLAVSKENVTKDQFDALSRAIAEMRQDGTLLRIFLRYFGDKDARNFMKP